MTDELLTEHRTRPTPETRAALRRFLHPYVRDIVKRYTKQLPHWFSRSALRSEVDEALTKALADLPLYSFPLEGLAAYVIQEIETALEPVFRRESGDPFFVLACPSPGEAVVAMSVSG